LLAFVVGGVLDDSLPEFCTQKIKANKTTRGGEASSHRRKKGQTIREQH
jgi:hypothetical protein